MRRPVNLTWKLCELIWFSFGLNGSTHKSIDPPNPFVQQLGLWYQTHLTNGHVNYLSCINGNYPKTWIQSHFKNKNKNTRQHWLPLFISSHLPLNYRIPSYYNKLRWNKFHPIVIHTWIFIGSPGHLGGEKEIKEKWKLIRWKWKQKQIYFLSEVQILSPSFGSPWKQFLQRGHKHLHAL